MTITPVNNEHLYILANCYDTGKHYDIAGKKHMVIGVAQNARKQWVFEIQSIAEWF